MAAQEGKPGRAMSRRQFLTLAGAGAVFGALILAATRQKGVQGILKATSTNRTSNPATAGKVIRTSVPNAQPVAPSLLQRLLGGKL